VINCVNLAIINAEVVLILCFSFSDPHFVSSYDIDDKIYFFFREDAVENINCGKVKSFLKIFLHGTRK